MIQIINKLKAELVLQQIIANQSLAKIYDLTSKEWSDKQFESVEDYKKAIKILEENNIK